MLEVVICSVWYEFVILCFFCVSDIGLAVRVYANGSGDLGSIPGRVIPKTQKMVLDASLLNTQHHKVRIKGKVEQFREGVAPSPTPWGSSYRKGSFRVTLDNGRQLYLCFFSSFTSSYDILLKIVLLIPLKYHTGNRNCRLLELILLRLNLEVPIFHCSWGGRLVALVGVCIVWNLEPLASDSQSSHKWIPHIICQFLYAREKNS